jgi:hypothetical protein
VSVREIGSEGTYRKDIPLFAFPALNGPYSGVMGRNLLSPIAHLHSLICVHMSLSCQRFTFGVMEPRNWDPNHDREICPLVLLRYCTVHGTVEGQEFSL